MISFVFKKAYYLHSPPLQSNTIIYLEEIGFQNETQLIE
jgi:hypothetical protein